MFTVNAEQKSMYGMMNQGMRMDMCMYMSMFCCAFMYQSLPEASAVPVGITGSTGL